MSSVNYDLDASLDDIADLPSFVSFPTGAYNFIFDKWEQKMDEATDASRIQVIFKLEQVVEVLPGNLNPGEPEPEAGSLYGCSFQLNNETGAGLLKKLLAPVAEKTGERQLRANLEAAKGMLFMLVLKRKHDKKKDEFYSNILEASLV